MQRKNRLVLAIVLILGLISSTGCKEMTRDTQETQQLPTWPKDAMFYTITELNTKELPPEKDLTESLKIVQGNYTTEGYVIATYLCPPCPKNAVCAPCQEKIIIGEKNIPFTPDQELKDNEMVIRFSVHAEDFTLGKKYAFLLEINKYRNAKETLVKEVRLRDFVVMK